MFDIDDKVICIRACNELRNGQTYTIESMYENSDNKILVRLKEISGSYFETRFKKVKNNNLAW